MLKENYNRCMTLKAAEHETPVKPFAEMNETELREFDQKFIFALEMGDDSAARASLVAGIPIYYRENSTPTPGIVKEYPDGHKELVTFESGNETFLCKL